MCFVFDSDNEPAIGWKVENLGDTHHMFIEKGVLGWFSSCDYGEAYNYHDGVAEEEMAITSLFRATHVFQKFDASWINYAKPSKLTFSSFMDHLETNKKNSEIWLGSYDVDINIEKMLEVAKDLNMSMDQVAVQCGMEASFAISTGGDDFMAEDEDAEKHLCENCTQGIVMWFQTIKRKRDDGDDEEEHKEDN